MVQPRIQWALILSYLIFRFPFKFFSLAGEIRKTNTPAALHICPKCTYFRLQPVSSQSSPLFASLAIPFDFCSLNCDAFDLFLFCWVFFRYSVLPARLLVSPLFYNYLRMCWHLLLFSSSFDRLFAILFKFQRPQKRLRCRLFLDKCLVLVRVCVR